MLVIPTRLKVFISMVVDLPHSLSLLIRAFPAQSGKIPLRQTPRPIQCKRLPASAGGKYHEGMHPKAHA
jgi:hypothetical protein